MLQYLYINLFEVVFFIWTDFSDNCLFSQWFINVRYETTCELIYILIFLGMFCWWRKIGDSCIFVEWIFKLGKIISILWKYIPSWLERKFSIPVVFCFSLFLVERLRCWNFIKDVIHRDLFLLFGWKIAKQWNFLYLWQQTFLTFWLRNSQKVRTLQFASLSFFLVLPWVGLS